jgi:hypothetical protein
MRQQIAVLVHRAALDRRVRPQRGERLLQPRRAVDDDEFRRLQPAFDEIVEQRAPSGFALASAPQAARAVICQTIPAGGAGATDAGSAFNTACGYSADASGAGSINTASGTFANASGDLSINTASGAVADASGDGSFNSAFGRGANARGAGSRNIASGFQANARGDGSANVALGEGAIATGAGTRNTALGAGSTATGANSTAIGAGATALGANQMVFGTGANIYVAPGINTSSTAAQVGATNFVTADAAGVLGVSPFGPGSIAALNGQVNNLNANVAGLWQSVGALRQSVHRGYEGTAIALALGSAALPDNKKFAIAGHYGQFRGEHALGGVALARVNDFLVVDAGVGVGLKRGGVGTRIGATWSW